MVDLAMAASRPLIRGSHRPSTKQVMDARKNGDNSFCTSASAEFFKNLPVAGVDGELDVRDSILLALRNVEPHTDPYVAFGEPKERLCLFWLVHSPKPVFFGVFGHEVIRMKAGDWVVFDDSLEHFVMADRKWFGFACQYSWSKRRA